MDESEEKRKLEIALALANFGNLSPYFFYSAACDRLTTAQLRDEADCGLMAKEIAFPLLMVLFGLQKLVEQIK